MTAIELYYSMIDSDAPYYAGEDEELEEYIPQDVVLAAELESASLEDDFQDI
jgi:hypothetical protein